MGFTLNGELEGEPLEKSSLKPGDQLVLCKALGTGVLFAARQQGRADGRWIHSALETMLQSNALSADLARKHGAHAATDITGFGLLGHLAEMLAGGPLRARVELSRVPLLTGVEQSFSSGCASTLQPGNIAHVQARLDLHDDAPGPRLQALYDPQTCGGLLIGVAAAQAEGLVQSLRCAGFVHAAVIGEVSEAATGAEHPISVIP